MSLVGILIQGSVYQKTWTNEENLMQWDSNRSNHQRCKATNITSCRLKTNNDVEGMKLKHHSIRSLYNLSKHVHSTTKETHH